MDTKSKLSIIIATYDQPLLTAKHVEGCMKGTVMPDEIIVVNDGGKPEILDEVRKVEKKTKIIYARINEDIPWNTNGAYNLGLLISTGDRIGIEDCDHIPYPDFYEKAHKKLDEGNDRCLGHRRTFVRMEDITKGYRNAGGHSLVGMYSRDILIRMKGYDERFGGHYGWNGADVNRRLEKLGCKTAVNSGYFMVTDGMSMKETRPMVGNKAKMEKENYWQLRRNKEEGGQVKIPMLNFTYDIIII